MRRTTSAVADCGAERDGEENRDGGRSEDLLWESDRGNVGRHCVGIVLLFVCSDIDVCMYVGIGYGRGVMYE